MPAGHPGIHQANEADGHFPELLAWRLQHEIIVWGTEGPLIELSVCLSVCLCFQSTEESAACLSVNEQGEKAFLCFSAQLSFRTRVYFQLCSARV